MTPLTTQAELVSWLRALAEYTGKCQECEGRCEVPGSRYNPMPFEVEGLSSLMVECRGCGGSGLDLHGPPGGRGGGT